MDESMWWEREGRFFIFVLYICLTDSKSVPVMDSSYEKRRMCLVLNRKEGLYLLGTSMLE